MRWNKEKDLQNRKRNLRHVKSQTFSVCLQPDCILNRLVWQGSKVQKISENRLDNNKLERAAYSPILNQRNSAIWSDNLLAIFKTRCLNLLEFRERTKFSLLWLGTSLRRGDGLNGLRPVSHWKNSLFIQWLAWSCGRFHGFSWIHFCAVSPFNQCLVLREIHG